MCLYDYHVTTATDISTANTNTQTFSLSHEYAPKETHTYTHTYTHTQVAAGYVMYGAACVMVLSTGNGVDGFTLDPASGEFVLSHPNIRIRPRRKIYSINRGNW